MKENQTRSWFFENISEIYKPLVRMMRKKGGNANYHYQK